MIPSKADPDAQVTYHQQEMQPRIAEAKAGQQAVFGNVKSFL